MAGFRKARGEQAALKMGIYGPPGSGKTFTSLLIAEGLSTVTGKRTAFIDTEHGTDFYAQEVKSRAVHPQAFDFDVLHTRSITDTVAAVRGLDPAVYGQVVIDSITHIWQAAMEAYGGGRTRADTIPMHAWGKIKKPYKDLLGFLLGSNYHMLILGREGTEYAKDDDTDELKAVGKKMKAEGETPYEPHILIRMEQVKARRTNEVAQIVAYAEKDRTGILSGRSYVNPTFDQLCRPLLPLLGATQAQMETLDATAAKDAERLAEDESDRIAKSEGLLKEMAARIALTKTSTELKKLGDEITPQLKSQMTTPDVQDLREAYLKRSKELPKGD
jgi:hypothetical protein